MPKIIKAEIDWAKGWGNMPTLKVTCDQMPDSSKVPHRVVQTQGSNLYWGQTEDGWVNFYCETPSDPTGYGGRCFNILMEDGSTRVIKGPWSSNSMSMNKYFPPCHEIIVYETEGKYPGLGYHGWNLLTGKFIDLVRAAGGDVVPIDSYSDRSALSDEQAALVFADFQSNTPLEKAIGLAIVIPGLTLKESQAKKNEGWSAGRQVN